MKKVFLILCCSVLAAALVACSEKEQTTPDEQTPQETVDPENPELEGEYSYTFSLAADETRSSFASNHIAWSDGDQVASYAKTSKNKYTDVEVNGDDVTITIRSTVALEAGDMVYAYAPYNKVNNEAEATAVTLEIPRNQVSGSADAMPMVSLPFELTGPVDKYTDTEVGTLQFLNLGSVIKLNIYKSSGYSAGEKIENVTFQAGVACAGSFTYNLTTVNANNPAAITGYTETDVVVSANGASPVTVGADKEHGGVFYIVVAPGTYAGTYVIRTSTGDYTYVSGSSREYKRAGLKPLDLDLASANWTPTTGYDSSIDSPREFAQFLAGTSSEDTGSYTISADLDMTGYTITSASGFGGTLNGNDHVISNITSNVPLFAEISGSVSNLTLDGTCAFTPAQTVTEFGALAAHDNGGTYTNVNTAASITITATSDIENNIALGGLVGASDNASGSRFTSCSNSGAITIDATGHTHWAVAMGGLVGWLKKASFNTCTNKGPLSLTAKYHKPFHQWAYVTAGDTGDVDGNTSLGGLVGKAWDINTNVPYSGGFLNYTYDAGAYGVSFQSCENASGGTITLTHTDIGLPSNDETDYGLMSVGGLCGQGNGSIESGSNYAVISVTAVDSRAPGADYWTRGQSMVQVGGLVGKSYRGMNMNSCTNRGAINVLYDGAWNKTEKAMAAVGGLIGSNSYDRVTSTIKFSANRAPITVTGYGTLNVGGICGANGSLRGDRVYDTATINVQARYAYVGGLVGFLTGGISTQFIKTSYCEANVTAESVLGDRYAFAVGGLIGRFATNSNTGNVSLAPYSSDSQRCHYTGNVVSTGQMKVGMVIGWVTENNEKVFGKEDTPILVTGTLYRWGLDASNQMSEPYTIHAGNVEDYAIGAIKAGTVTIYVSSETPAPQPAANLTLMSFNIREGSNWSDRKSPIVSMINGENPDIIGLQEVKDLDYWDHLTENHPWDYLTDHLSAYTGYRSGTRTNAILYKTSTVELSNTGIFWLRDGDYSSSGDSWDGYERTALYATVREKATGRYFFYVTTHLPMNNSNDGWAKSTALLESRIAALNTNDYPVILMGDMNCVIGDACWDSIKTWMNNTRYSAASIVSTENRDLYTYNAFGDSSKARNKVDHIWVSKSITVDSYVTLTSAVHNYGGYTTNGETFLSDHYPVIAHIS